MKNCILAFENQVIIKKYIYSKDETQFKDIINPQFFFFMSCNYKQYSDKHDADEQSILIDVKNNEVFLFIGTYTNSDTDDGVFLYKLNTQSGQSEFISKVQSENSSFMTLSRDQKYLYTVGENGAENSKVSSFEFDKSKGILTFINSRPTYGADPCYIETNNEESYLLTANYSGGSITVFPIDEQGVISDAETILKFSGSGADSVRQQQSHLHSLRFSPDSRYVFAADLGSDKIYRLNALGSVFLGQPIISESSLVEFDTPPGTGPRHFDFHPNGEYFYLLGELSGEVIVYDYNNGDLIEKQTILSDTVGARGAADIHVSSDGRYLYSSNRLEGDGLAIFAINDEDGTLTRVGFQSTGKHPRNFTITPDGNLLLVAVKDDNRIEIYSIDKETGLTSILNADINVQQPVFVKSVSATE